MRGTHPDTNVHTALLWIADTEAPLVLYQEPPFFSAFFPMRLGDCLRFVGFLRLAVVRCFILTGSEDFWEALTKCTDHASNALKDIPKHPIPFNIRG